MKKLIFLSLVGVGCLTSCATSKTPPDLELSRNSDGKWQMKKKKAVLLPIGVDENASWGTYERLTVEKYEQQKAAEENQSWNALFDD